MVVDSPLALFTTLFGWQFYNAIWFTLLGTGIALLPFLGVLIEAIITDREDGQFLGSNPEGIYKRIEVKILVMLAVVALAAQPSSLTALQPGTISFTPQTTVLNPEPIQATAADPNNTFAESGFTDFAELNADTVPVPIWWFSVLTVSSGINAAVLAGFPDIESVRDITRLTQMLQIGDPIVQSEVSVFYSQCYLPARGFFERENPTGADSVDVSFIGSRFFLEEFQINGGAGPVVYEALRPNAPVNGFPFNAARDTEWLPEFQPEFGKPTCRQWWLGEGTNGRPGLRQLLLDQMNVAQDGIVDRLVAGVTSAVPVGLGREAIEDRLIQGVLTRTPRNFSNASFGEQIVEPSDGSVQALFRASAKPIITAVGVEAAAGGLALVMDVVTQLMPMLQPMILMAIFALLPFGLVASRYSISFLVVGAVGIFTVNFWPVLWHIATWVDDNLLRALFPAGITAGGSSPLFDFILIPKRLILGTLGEVKLTLLNMVTSVLFLLLPGFFSVVMAWAGTRAAHTASALSSAATNNSATGKASSGPGQVTNSTVGRGVSSNIAGRVSRGIGR